MENKHGDFRSRVENGYYHRLEYLKDRQGCEHVVKEYVVMAKQQFKREPSQKGDKVMKYVLVHLTV